MRPYLFTLIFAAAGAAASAAPPTPPPEFAGPQSPPKPAPFPVKYVDQGEFDPRLKGLRAPEGFKVDLVADTPVVVNPVGLTFGPDGTLFVLEWTVDPVTKGNWFEFKETFRYRDGTTKQVATMKKFVMDPVKKLIPGGPNGSYDRAETLIGEELPSSVMYHDGWLYTSGRGTVRRYKQSRPGGPWDIREVIAQGFCGFHHHQVSGLTIGTDGKLYITSGDDDNFVEGSDGSRATALRTGAIFRCNPDGSKMELFSLGYRNPYRDLAYDDKFNLFHADNDNEDGSKFTGCRLMHVAEDVDYGWRLRLGARCCRPDNARGAVAGELPGKLPPMLKTGRGSPAGLLIYNDTQLPEQYRGLLYYPDVFRKLVRAYKVEQAGATFAVTNEFEFLNSDDPLFRPCQMVTGPDGAIYVCDWRTDSGGAGRLSGDGVHGRIYRVWWAGTKSSPGIPLRPMDTWAKLAGPQTPLDALVTGYRSPDATTRQLAQREMVRRAKKNPDLVRGYLRRDADAEAGLPTPVRLLCVGGLQQLWTPTIRDFFLDLTRDADPDVRRLAAEALGENATPEDAGPIHEALGRLLTDQSLAVRRVAALAVARVGVDGAADALISAWKFDDAHDAFLTDGYIHAIEKLGKPGVQALLALAASGQKADLDRAVTAFVAFRTAPAFEALPEMLANPHLSAAGRADLIRSYTNYLFDPMPSFDPLVNFLLTHPNESAPVKIAGLDVLASTGTVSGPRAVGYVLALLDAAEPETRLAALQVVESTRLTEAVPKLAHILADPKRQAGERTAVLKALRSTGGAAAIQPLVELLNRTEPAILKAEALRALAAAAPDRARPIAEKLLDQPDPTLLAEAVGTLSNTKAGAIMIGERYVAKKLPRDLFQRVSDALQKFVSDPAVAKVYGEVMKGGLFLSFDPIRAEQIRKQVLTKGDPKRGKELFLNTALLACATCHRIEGVGGSVGPDLTRLWDTLSTEKILESIVEPSKEIKEGYQSYKAVTVNGQVFTGLKVSETPQAVVIREANGHDVRIGKEDLDELSVSKVSLMPDNVISQLSYDQFIDLLAFLKNRAAQESLRGSAVEFAVATGFKPALNEIDPLEKSPNPFAKTAAGAPIWQVRPVEPSGLLNLAPLLPPGRSAAYVLAYVHSVKAQKVTLALETEDAVRVSVGGKIVFENPVTLIPHPRKVAPKIAVDLPAGWTPILVKLVTTGKDHTFRLQIEGDNLRTTTRPDEK
ncbi:PVC-type heme-binding CxxCH protein [Fimbriiglobus ruber]|uniref:Cytochrome c domain-containing protein n=1 Tax=Fimbriiglobus ruber TaxID=1908690 RepID=A0A225EB47_9BACT|nr:PVC-type heme-binding CxxCH protein [Fimbriiglobus ruber]OWK45617.1 hypothetical protein FRUB_01948 [Fimbriiglobus ruber]